MNRREIRRWACLWACNQIKAGRDAGSDPPTPERYDTAFWEEVERLEQELRNRGAASSQAFYWAHGVDTEMGSAWLDGHGWVEPSAPGDGREGGREG